jgi:murein DD-endopeptidase MepM/ murein hydrolase activator NlpD
VVLVVISVAAGAAAMHTYHLVRPFFDRIVSVAARSEPGAAVRPAVKAYPALATDFEALRRKDLLFPVIGVETRRLTDTFAETRGGNRPHEALDVIAPRGSSVVAVDDGHIAKLFASDRGGLTIYQFDPTQTFSYYYAHLDRYAPGLLEGQPVRKGDKIGEVGSTGNARSDAPHLHFTIFRLGPERRWWEGTPINPFTLWGGR